MPSMHKYRVIQSMGIIALVIASILFWESYQTRVCTLPLPAEAASCGPNLLFFVPAILTAIVGIILTGYGQWKISGRAVGAG